MEVKESLYILDDKATLHCLQSNDDLQSSDGFKSATLIDFAERSLVEVIDHIWAHIHLSSTALTYNDTVY